MGSHDPVLDLVPLHYGGPAAARAESSSRVRSPMAQKKADPYNKEMCKYDNSTDTYPVVECVCVHDAEEDAAHLSAMGITFTIFFTYFGFALFLVGNLWNANIMDKCRDIRHKYRVLRGLS